jgi:hypothetical protein
MLMKVRSIFCGTVAGAAFVLSGCSFHGGPGAASGMLPATHALADSILPDAKTLRISGTYQGSAEWQEGTKEDSASLKMTIRQHGKKISGAFDLSKNGQSRDLSIKGSITSKSANEVKIKFDILDPHGRTAQAQATITGKSLSGEGNVPGSSSKPSVYVKFSAKKKTKHKH